MKLARYIGEGLVRIDDEPEPAMPAGGLKIRAEACGLCSGELMSWYMDRKIPHVLGHECVGKVVESQDARFSAGTRVFVHHHAPCLQCRWCLAGLEVHCPQWKRTRLVPGGMSESYVCGPENLTDAFEVDDLAPEDAALIEPLGCVHKSLETLGEGGEVAVVGLGFMGLAHLLALGEGVGFETNPARRTWAERWGIDARPPSLDRQFSRVVVCPGSEQAIRLALSVAEPGAKVVLFAPMAPNSPVSLDLEELYFREVSISFSYSCGPRDTLAAARWLREKRMGAEQLVSDFISLGELPQAYAAMARGDILKPMVLFR